MTYCLRVPITLQGVPPLRSVHDPASAPAETVPVQTPVSEEKVTSCSSMVPLAVPWSSRNAVQITLSEQPCWATVH
jgi:hypothetical protein